MNSRLQEPADAADFDFASTTVDGEYALELIQGYKEKSLNVNDLLEAAGISSELLKNPNARVGFRQLGKLSINIIDRLNDEYYGLIDKPQPRGTFRLICYAAISSDNIGEAMQRLLEFSNLLANTWQHVLQQDDSELSYRLHLREGSVLKHRIALEYHYLIFYRTLCWMAGRQLPLKRVELTVPASSHPERYRYMFYDAPVHFGSKSSGLIFRKEVYHYENIRQKRDIEEFLNQTPLTLLTQTIESNNLTTRTRMYLEGQLKKTNKLASMQATAEYLHLKPQTFRRRLKLEQTSFNQIKSDMRRDLAINLMLDTKMSIASISESLDFSEPSAFIRAFRQWTGSTPLTYRKNMLAKTVAQH